MASTSVGGPGGLRPEGARALLLGAFFVSGASGLAYELIWSRYLALLLGHSAYAQVVVIAVYLGGMAIGAVLVGQRAAGIGRPLTWYVRAELVLAALGVLFHPVFLAVSDVSFDVLLPALPGALGLATPWILSVLLLLPPAVLLGATFPLMAGGLLRSFREGAGRTVADAYLWNALGGAVGVLVAGFLLLPGLGMAGALLAAAAGNLVAAALVAGVARSGLVETGAPRADAAEAPPGTRVETRLHAPAEAAAEGPAPGPAVPSERLERVVLVVLGAAFLTAVASFIYEIAWIRMLSLVMGSATHSFELMLSAFILGLAGGSWLVRDWVDRTDAPVRLLGGVQWLMGFAALATLPLYAASFGMMSAVIGGLPDDGSGYVAFNVARYGIGLLVMLPSTVMAGATLPLMTAILLRRGAGERSVGWVYGVNTFGSVSGVVAAGLILLPLLGLEGLLVAGASLDMALGAGLLLWSRKGSEGTDAGLPVAAACATVLAALGALLLVQLDRAVLTAGVFRYGELPDPDREVLYYEDGRTSTVGVHLLERQQLVVITNNGKPDASLPLRWIGAASGREVDAAPLVASDAATQTLAALTLLAHRPGAGTALNIGHGSGMSADALLAADGFESVVTAEIEPAMVRGSRAFLPANERVFTDPRHAFVLDDARSYLARAGRDFDLILSEPPNPWVSGTASLFTEEFYRRVRGHLAPGGLFGQWLQLYELDDDLVLSVLAALHRVFPEYRGYLVGPGDLVIVAGEEVPDPDWAFLVGPAVRSYLAHLPPLGAPYMETLEAFRGEGLAPLLDTDTIPANSDFHPVLEAGAERARYENRYAVGVRGLAADRFDLLATLRGERRPLPDRYEPPPIGVLSLMRDLALATWLGEIQRGDRPLTEPPFPEWRRPYLEYLLLMERMEAGGAPEDWSAWIEDFTDVEASLHAGTVGWADEAFYATAWAYLERHDAPDVARAAVGFLHGLAAGDMEEAAGATDRLRDIGGVLGPPLAPALLLDGGVVAYVATGRPGDARQLYREIEPRARRPANDLRNRLLRAYMGRSAGGDAGGG